MAQSDAQHTETGDQQESATRRPAETARVGVSRFRSGGIKAPTAISSRVVAHHPLQG